MKSIAVTAPGKVSIVKTGKPKIGEYDALIKTEISFICNATDRKVIDYHMPGLGRENYPLLLGHESVGRVVAIGKKVRTFSVGDRVIGGLVLEPQDDCYGSGWGGHSEYVVAKDADALLADSTEYEDFNETYKIMRKVPEDIPVESAGLLCTWREVYSGLFNDFSLTPDMRILIFGAGPVGLSFVRFTHLSGFKEVISIDLLENKRATALKLGADDAFSPDDPALLEYVDKHGKFDAVIDAVGNPGIINKGLSLIGMGGSVCVFGVVGNDSFTLDKFAGPYNFNLLFHQWPTREAEAAAQEPLIEWIRSGKLDYSDFVTSRFHFTEAEEAVQEVNKASNIKTMLDFRD